MSVLTTGKPSGLTRAAAPARQRAGALSPRRQGRPGPGAVRHLRVVPDAGLPDRIQTARENGRLQGAYRTVFRGNGIDFTGLRMYTPEDDVRHIDWNVTARLDEPYVRLYAEDRELTAWLVLDHSASMRLQGKDSVRTDLAVSLGRLFTKTGNRVGAILYDNRYQRIIPPRTGRTHMLYLTDQLTRPPATAPDGRTTDLAAMLHLAAGLDDVLHVPFRRALVPGYDEVTSAARQAGAYGATLSGSGPTVVAVVASDGVRAVGDAMVRAWGARDIASQTFHAARPAGGFETA